MELQHGLASVIHLQPFLKLVPIDPNFEEPPFEDILQFIFTLLGRLNRRLAPTAGLGDGFGTTFNVMSGHVSPDPSGEYGRGVDGAPYILSSPKSIGSFPSYS